MAMSTCRKHAARPVLAACTVQVILLLYAGIGLPIKGIHTKAGRQFGVKFGKIGVQRKGKTYRAFLGSARIRAGVCPASPKLHQNWAEGRAREKCNKYVGSLINGHAKL